MHNGGISLPTTAQHKPCRYLSRLLVKDWMNVQLALLVVAGIVAIAFACAFRAWYLRRSVTKLLSFPEVTGISLRARQAIALRLFEGYVARVGLRHAEIDRFLEWWWEFVLSFGDGDWFGRWENSEPLLEGVAFGAACPADIAELLEHAGVPQAEFLKALYCTSEVASGSFFAASDEKGSRQHLYELAEIATAHEVAWPDLGIFSSSRWDGDGWGLPPTVEQVAIWRTA